MSIATLQMTLSPAGSRHQRRQIQKQHEFLVGLLKRTLPKTITRKYPQDRIGQLQRQLNTLEKYRQDEIESYHSRLYLSALRTVGRAMKEVQRVEQEGGMQGPYDHQNTLHELAQWQHRVNIVHQEKLREMDAEISGLDKQLVGNDWEMCDTTATTSPGMLNGDIQKGKKNYWRNILRTFGRNSVSEGRKRKAKAKARRSGSCGEEPWVVV